MGRWIHPLERVRFRIVVASVFLSLVRFHGRLGVCATGVGRSCMIHRLFLLGWFSLGWRDPSFSFQQFSILDFAHEVSIPFLFQRCRPRTRRAHVRPSDPPSRHTHAFDRGRGCRAHVSHVTDQHSRPCASVLVRSFVRHVCASVAGRLSFSFLRRRSCRPRRRRTFASIRAFVSSCPTFPRIPTRGLGACEGVEIHATWVAFAPSHPHGRASDRIDSTDTRRRSGRLFSRGDVERCCSRRLVDASLLADDEWQFDRAFRRSNEWT
mmetsp:Transcript_10159/g.61836  ORF Transcript_10159/g.61836 Transcript_10159/m.61836 type:complete len:266 (+) Transcript_10159:1414-2211(+)